MITVGCGQMPQPDATSPGAPWPGQDLQQLSFTGSADPVSGLLQIVVGPQAALATITEDKDGNPDTVTAGTAQIYASSVAFGSGGVGYPVGCNSASPMVMSASVEVFSGFTEQLRNVYARIDAKSGGQTFCTRDLVSGFSAVLTPNLGLYLYQPLDRGTSAGSALRRSASWSMNLPDNGGFWFSGTLLGEVVPQLPTLILPANNASFLTGNATGEVAFSWKDDTSANGSNVEGFAVARPTRVGAELAIQRCGVATAAFDATPCTANFLAPTVYTGQQASALPPIGYWYQWTLRAAFRLPGDAITTIGTQVSTRHFKVVKG